MSRAKRRAVPKGQPGLDLDLAAPPEWEIVQAAVAAGRAREPDAWAALAACPAVEVYTDGSAPLRNPGGDSGFAAVFTGWAAPTDPVQAVRATPLTRVEVGGYLPARTADPPTSNNRAEIAGVLAALTGLRALDRAPAARVWSDSEYTIRCALGDWQRRKNTDLWPLMDRLLAELGVARRDGVALEWVRGHAGNAYNEAADALSTHAAFNFDDAQVARYRAAQAATGQELPGAAALARHGVTGPAVSAPSPPAPPPAPAAPPAEPAAPLPVEPPAAPAAPAPPPAPDGPLSDATYTLVLHTRLAGGTGPEATGRYRLWTRDGRSRLAEDRHSAVHGVAEAEYHTLIAALTDLVARITAAGRDPAHFTVAVYSQQELVVKQLTGAYQVKAAALQAPHAAARALIARFRRADLVWKPAKDLKEYCTETSS